MGNNPLFLPMVLAAASTFNSAFKWGAISERVPIWWKVDSSPALWVSRGVGVTGLILLQLLISYIIYILVAQDPAVVKQTGESKQAVAQLIVLPSLFFFCIHNFLFLESAFVSADHYFSPRLFVACIALWLLVWLGYNLQFIKPNYIIGVVTPWTTGNSGVWELTHARAGYVLPGAGLVLLICAIFIPTGIPLLIITLIIWFGSYIFLVFLAWDIARIQSLKDPLLRGDLPTPVG